MNWIVFAPIAQNVQKTTLLSIQQFHNGNLLKSTGLMFLAGKGSVKNAYGLCNFLNNFSFTSGITEKVVQSPTPFSALLQSKQKGAYAPCKIFYFNRFAFIPFRSVGGRDEWAD